MLGVEIIGRTNPGQHIAGSIVQSQDGAVGDPILGQALEVVAQELLEALLELGIEGRAHDCPGMAPAHEFGEMRGAQSAVLGLDLDLLG